MAHPVHPMLVHFPIAFWTSATVCDLLSVHLGERISEISGIFLMLGIVTAIIAMLGGLIELDKIKKQSQAMHIVNLHILFAVLTWSLYTASLFIRLDGTILTRPGVLEIGLSIAGFLCLCIAGLLGGKLVYEYGIGVEKV